LGTAEFRGCPERPSEPGLDDITERREPSAIGWTTCKTLHDLPKQLPAVVSLRAVVPGGVAELVECDGLENR
jgi:hypothetical protein